MTTFTPRRHSGYVVIANRGAGSTEEAAVNAAVARLATDAPTVLDWTEEPEECLEIVKGLEDDRQLVVAGGDGSIHLALSVVTHVERTDGPVGIIPLGTGNDFARNHGIPLDPVEAADVVIAGHAVGVDAMTLDGERAEKTNDGRPQLVANNIHVGLGVKAAQTASRWKARLGRFSYPLATGYEGYNAETTELTVTADGDVVHDGPLLAALVLLGPSMGGGVEMMPEEPDRLDLVLIEAPDGAGDRAGLVAAALRHRVADAERADHREVSRVTIEGRSGLSVNVDGEMVDYRGPVTVEHLPSAWKVLLPVS